MYLGKCYCELVLRSQRVQRALRLDSGNTAYIPGLEFADEHPNKNFGGRAPVLWRNVGSHLYSNAD